MRHSRRARCGRCAHNTLQMSGGGRPGPPSLWSCKPGFVRPAAKGRPFDKLRAGSHSSTRCVATTMQQPTRTSRVTFASGRAAPWSLFGLAPEGVWPATSVATRAVRPYRTFSPLPAPFVKLRASSSRRSFGPSWQPAKPGGRYVFCATIPGCAFETHPVAVSDPPALWSPDFPPNIARGYVGRLPGPRKKHTRPPPARQGEDTTQTARTKLSAPPAQMRHLTRIDVKPHVLFQR